MTPEVGAVLVGLARGEGFSQAGTQRTRCRIRGRDLVFCTAVEHDPIQRKMRSGAFYETSDLYLLDGHFPAGGTFIDVGANIGNHSLYFAVMLGAGRVIPIEPNPVCWRLLVENVLANDVLDRFDLSRLGVGLGAARAGGYGMERRERNLGAAAMVAGEGDLEVWRGDDLLAGEAPDLIKIDVEGAEMAARQGLQGLIAQHRPRLFVEVAAENDAAFRDWVAAAGYAIALTRNRYRKATNYLAVPE